MLLNQVSHFNDLSPKLRSALEDKVKGFGKSVRYKFNISHNNPAPMGEWDKTIYPNMYTLDPAIFNINDPHEDRKDKQKSKRIGIIEGVDDKGIPNKFGKIRVSGKFKGFYKLELDVEEDFNKAIFLELHPKLTGGMFSDKSKQQMFSRVDENAAATIARTERSARAKARKAAEDMTEQDVINFCDAMIWDSSRDEVLMRNDIEELAETNPEYFNELVKGKSIEYQAIVKQAVDRNIIAFDPAEYKFKWVGNQQTITILTPISGKNEIEKMGEWLQVGGKKTEEVYKKIKSLVSEEPVPLS